jgi:hypothetical protein
MGTLEMRARRHGAMLALVLVAWLGALAFLSGAPALAATGHKFLSQLTEAPPGTPINEPTAVAVDKAGEVFVGDSGGLSAAPVVDVFTASGAFKTQLGAGVLQGEPRGVAVDDSTGDVYVADAVADVVDVFKPNGSGGYELLSRWTGADTPSLVFGEVAGVAVDSSTGQVYVVDALQAVVDVFKAKPTGPEEGKEGEFVSTLKGKPTLEGPDSVAVNGKTGQVVVGDGSRADVEVFSSSGVFETRIIGKSTPTKAFGEVAGVGVEEATGDVYVADPVTKVVDQFNPAGEWIGWITSAAGAPLDETSRAVAVAPAGDVYLTDLENALVNHFGPSVAVPDAKSAKPTKIERTTATLNGSINPDGKPAEYKFEWGETEEYGHSTTLTSAGAGSVETKVSAAIEDLKPETIYDFRIVGVNENGSNDGANIEFITPPAVELSTGSASEVETTSAKLSGSLEPDGIETEYHFEYGESTAYGNSSPVPSAKTSASGSVAAETGLSGLRPNTTYHFRLAATNSFGTTFGADAKFTTAGPPRITDEPTAPIGHTSATLNAKIDPDERATKYHFEYGETKSYGTSTTEAELAAGETPDAVKAELTGLKLATTYHFRVVATNSAGPPVVGPDQEFTTALIESESAEELTSEGATLQAVISPLGVNTTYHFEYGQTTSYGTSIPVPDGSVGAGAVPVTVSQAVSGLAPEATYHYRVVATVEGLGTAAGPDHTFTTLPGTARPVSLPDGRAYEMVSPPDKHGGFIEPISAPGGAIQASEDGSALAYVVDGPLVEDPEGNRSPELQQILATRGSSEWASQEIVAPHERAFGLRAGRPPEYQAFSADLSLSLLQPFPYGLTPAQEPSLSPPLSEAERGHQEKTIYLRNDAPISPSASEATIYVEAKQNGEALASEHGEAEAKPGYLPLITAANVAPDAKFGGEPIPSERPPLPSTRVEPDLTFLGATPDLSHVVLRSSKAALAQQSPSAPGLYEWAAGKLQLVSVLPSGEPAAEVNPKESDLGFGYNSQPPNTRNAISNDGTRIVWTYDEAGSPAGLGHLYLRDTAKEETVQLDAPEEGLAKPETGEAHFQIASTDDSKVFFTDTQRLTADSTAAPEEASKGIPARPDLYECEVVEAGGKLECKLSDLTVDQAPGEHAAVQGQVLAAAEDGSSVYFVATGALAAGGESGADNLYVLRQSGAGWTTGFIARLSSEDIPDWGFDKKRPNLINMTARVSPNGNYLAFMSNRSLTGYDNTDVNEETGQHADEEVFLYNASAESVTCASCNPSGARPRGVFDTELAGEGAGLLVDRPGTWKDEAGSVITADHWLAGSIPGWTPITIQASTYQSRYLSNEGRMFFTSADPLVPGIADATRKETIVAGKEATVGVENVYEYEPNGLGSCASGAGCVSLLSSGTSDKESAFLDASVNGNDVFLLTASSLLPQDQDSSYDVYDARVCSESSPCQTPPAPAPAACAEVATCRGGSSTLPTFQAPPSVTIAGSVPAAGKAGTLPAKTTKPAPLTRAQKFARALKTCRKLPKKTRAQKKRRATCESQARKKYGPKKSAKKSPKRSTKGKK